VQKHGPLVEGLLHQIARSAVGPEMNAKFAANDANVRSFVDWAKRRGVGLEDDALVEAFHNGATGLRNEFEADPNAPKYDSVGDKVQPRQVTPDQQMQQGFKAEDVQIERKRAAYESQVQADPEYGKRFGFDALNGGTYDKTQQAPTFEQMKSNADIRNAELEKAGVNKRTIVVPKADGTAQEVEVTVPPKSVYANMGNERFRAKDQDSQEKAILEIMENEAIAESSMDATQSQKATARAKTLRSMFGLSDADLVGGESASAAKPIDRDTAAGYMEKAGGDPAKARELAKADGWSF